MLYGLTFHILFGSSMIELENEDVWMSIGNVEVTYLTEMQVQKPFQTKYSTE